MGCGYPLNSFIDRACHDRPLRIPPFLNCLSIPVAQIIHLLTLYKMTMANDRRMAAA
jgi:hypothetical protein